MSIVQKSNNTNFDPFDIVGALQRCPFFNSPTSLSPFYTNTSSYTDHVRVDWKETPNSHVLKADLPGLTKEHVRVEVEDGKVLKISGERIKDKAEEKESDDDKWHCVERGGGKFIRRFRLPVNAKVDEVNASMENGVLTVIVGKKEVKKPEVKAIEISG